MDLGHGRPGLAVAAGINGVRGAVSGLQPAAQWQSPGTEKMYPAAGDWVVFEQATARRGPTARLEPTVGWRQLTVIGPDGEVPVTCAYCSGSETMTLGTTQYVGLIRFTADVEGEYAVTTETPGATLSVSPSVLRTVGLTFATTIAWVGLGLLIFFIGAVWLLVLLIVHLLRPAAQGTANPGQSTYLGTRGAHTTEISDRARGLRSPAAVIHRVGTGAGGVPARRAG